MAFTVIWYGRQGAYPRQRRRTAVRLSGREDELLAVAGECQFQSNQLQAISHFSVKDRDIAKPPTAVMDGRPTV